MKLSAMRTNDEIIAKELASDPEFRAEWERTALARAVALAIIRYRAEHELSQRDLAQRPGVKQPQVARLEIGEVNPSIETLMRISSRLVVELSIDIRPTRMQPERMIREGQPGEAGPAGGVAEVEFVVAGQQI